MPNITSWNEHYLTNKDVNGHSVSDWLKKDPNSKLNAICFLCKKTFSISNGGMKQINQHATG